GLPARAKCEVVRGLAVLREPLSRRAARSRNREAAAGRQRLAVTRRAKLFLSLRIYRTLRPLSRVARLLGTLMRYRPWCLVAAKQEDVIRETYVFSLMLHRLGVRHG